VTRVLRFAAVHDPAQVDWIVGLLRRQILNGDLPPGEPVSREFLANTYAVPLPVVNAAQGVLTDEGLLETDPLQGAYVRELSAEDIAEIFSIRKHVEIAALHACRQAEREEFRIMEATAEAMRRSFFDNDWAGVVESDLLFHRLLIRFLGNSRIGDFYWHTICELRPMLAALDRAVSSDVETMISEHELVVEDLVAGDISGASERLIKHLTDTEARLQIMLMMKYVPPRRLQSR
jgi:DNA-binding GntR family transcriptional regulator